MFSLGNSSKLDDSLAVAVLVLQAAAARTGIVASDFLVNPDGAVGPLLAISGKLVAGGLHAGHVSPAGNCSLPDIGPLPSLVFF